ncbi:MAG TPA: hypothetical protein VGB91_02390 [Rhizomicrobium sp.]
MKNVNLFQYLAAFVTIMLAIALTDLLMSLHRLILARRRVTWAVIPLAAAFYVFLAILSEFFSIWIAAAVATVSFFYLLLLVTVSGLAALAAFGALPDEVPQSGLDLWTFYVENRAYLYIVLALAFIGDLIRTLLHYRDAHGRFPLAEPGFWTQIAIPTLVVVAVYATLAWSRRRTVHVAGLAALYMIVNATFFGWHIGN